MFILESFYENKYENIDIQEIIKESTALRLDMHKHIYSEAFLGVVDEAAAISTFEKIKQFILDKLKKIMKWFSDLKRNATNKQKEQTKPGMTKDESELIQKFDETCGDFFLTLDKCAHKVQISYNEDIIDQFDSLLEEIEEKEKEVIEILKLVKDRVYECDYTVIDTVGQRMERRLKSWNTSDIEKYTGKEEREYWKHKIPMMQKLYDKHMKMIHAIGNKIAISCNIDKNQEELSKPHIGVGPSPID